MLATLTRAPSVFSPRRDLLRAQQRASLVLDSMVETGAITQAQADDATRPSRHHHRPRQRRCPQLFPRHRRRRGARKLATDERRSRPAPTWWCTPRWSRKLQEAARLAAAAHHQQIRQARAHASEAAVVMMKPDGAVSRPDRRHRLSTTRCSTAPPRRIASRARPSSPSSIWRRWNPASRPGTRATTSRWTSTATRPTNFGGTILWHPDPGRCAGASGQHHHRQPGAGSRHHESDRGGAALRHHLAAGSPMPRWRWAPAK